MHSDQSVTGKILVIGGRTLLLVALGYLAVGLFSWAIPTNLPVPGWPLPEFEEWTLPLVVVLTASILFGIGMAIALLGSFLQGSADSVVSLNFIVSGCILVFMALGYFAVSLFNCTGLYRKLVCEAVYQSTGNASWIIGPSLPSAVFITVILFVIGIALTSAGSIVRGNPS